MILFHFSSKKIACPENECRFAGEGEFLRADTHRPDGRFRKTDAVVRIYGVILYQRNKCGSYCISPYGCIVPVGKSAVVGKFRCLRHSPFTGKRIESGFGILQQVSETGSVFVSVVRVY